MRWTRTTLTIFATAIGVLATLGLPAASIAGVYRVISYASGSGVHHASSGFDTGVSKPKAMMFRVAVDPDQQIKIEYQVACRGHGDESLTNRTIRTPSSQIDLPLGIDHARSCLVHAFATYNNPTFPESVSFKVELRAKQRPGAAPTD